MHLIIVSCTPRAVKQSNTDKIITAFREGLEAEGATSETHYLVHREKWGEIRQAFGRGEWILFALPLFVECVPGIMMEFLEGLPPREYSQGESRARLAFLLQGGFAEASQLRCGEAYLEKLPGYLNCDYAGTLIKGNMFAVSLLPQAQGQKMVAPFAEMGRAFARQGLFDKEAVTRFARPEYFSKGKQALLTALGPVQRLMLRTVAKSLGCTRPLDDTPYKEHVAKK